MASRPEARPTGTFTFLFSDIDGSTKLVQRFGADWPPLLERHRVAMRAAFADHGGWEQGTEGDSFFAIFESATDAAAAAVQAQRSLAAIEWPPDGQIRVRMGLHSGEGRLSGDDYVGIDVHRAARIAAAGHGGQVLLSGTTAALVDGAPPAGTRLLDLGSHRLKDLPEPERIRQLAIDGLPSEFPPLRSLGGRASNLPVALSSLIGRETEVEAVRSLLGASRLVTVTGAGGTGKTRVVQEVARRSASAFDAGATFVPLEAVRDADLIPTEILRSLRLDTAASTPPRDRLIEALRDEASPLVLDNLEQVTGAAAVIRDLLGAAPGLAVLASSQAALHVAGEQEFALPPLPDEDSIRLFIERARAVRPDFELDDAGYAAVAAICQRLDGLPLAIELAAAQTRLLAPAAILARITDRLDALATRQGDLPERQRTLRATVAWSYGLLDPGAQRLFRRLSVFVGGATLADIEAFEGRRGRSDEVLETLDGLVDRSIVVVRRPPAEEHRFALPSTVRSVARELLREAAEEPEALFRALATTAEANLYGRDRRAWLDRLAAEHDNLRAAIDRLTAAGDLEGALDLAANLWRFWQVRGHLVEARERLDQLLGAAADRTDLDPGILSRAEEAAGSVTYWMRVTAGDEVEDHYQRSLALARQAGDRRREAWAMYNLAFVFDFIGMSRHYAKTDLARGTEMRAEALAIFREIGDRRGIGESLWALGGNAAIIQQEPDIARTYLAEAFTVLAETGNRAGAAWSSNSLAFLETQAGNLPAARAAALDSAELFIADDDVSGLVVILKGLGAIAAREGDDRTAIRLRVVSELLAAQVGIDPPLIAILDEPLDAAASRLSPEAIAEETAAGRSIEARPYLRALVAERGAAKASV
jgi:predicted ATPase/class 3 adenylate cyclase